MSNVYSNKSVKMAKPLNIKNLGMLDFLDAYTHEVNVFMHCHLRGYDKTGCGMEMVAHYYDKYGAPLSAKKSWQEGYRAIEEELSEHFRLCANTYSEMPLIAGYGGGVHLYKPINMHNDKPWNMVGWIPLENKWCCDGKYFKNRNFFALRGNEIQNDLWDYHPYKSQEEKKDPLTDEQKFEQFVPRDKYRGGYWYENNVNGRYLHIIALKDHVQDSIGASLRYNYIVHPLAYRNAIKDLPDNAVDGMQWSITNINTEKHFSRSVSEEQRKRKWGEKCHGLEVFNDFTYYYSWQPLNLDDNDKVLAAQEIFNGTVMNWQHSQREQYHYWFDSYPLEFGEFLLDSALSCGTYLHPVSANDGFYNRNVVPESQRQKGETDKNAKKTDDGDESDEELEGMERVLMADPKGRLIRASKNAIKPSDMFVNRRFKKLQEMRLQAEHDGEMDKEEQIKEILKFYEMKPYHYNSVFGYTALLDPNLKMHETIQNNEPTEIHDGAEDWVSGLNIVESTAIERLRNGQFFGHTGVSDIFEYDEYEVKIPYQIHEQPNPSTLCPEMFGQDGDNMKLVFTFPRCKEKNEKLIWRYTIQVLDEIHDPKKVTTTQGYFKLSKSARTVLDLTNYRQQAMCWIRFTVFDPENHMRRAWFPAVRGASFGGGQTFEDKHKDGPVEDLGALIPAESIRIATLYKSTDDEPKADPVRYTEKEPRDFLKPYALKAEGSNQHNLEICMKKCSACQEENTIFSYFMQVKPIKQTIDHDSEGTRNSQAKPDNPDEPVINRIQNTVHGYFQLSHEIPSKIMLRRSWDEETVVDKTVYVYAIDANAQPKDVSDLMLPDGLPFEN